MTAEYSESSLGVRRTRIDKPHDNRRAAVIEDAPAPPASVLQAVAGKSAAGEPEQLEQHARELGNRLQDQQRMVDRRQAEFNAQLAQMENDLRTTRLIQREKEQELAERETEFQTRWQMIQEQATDVATAELALQSDSQERRLDDSYNRDHLKQSLERWKQRLKELDKSELQLQAHLAEVASEREQLEEERAALDQLRSKLQQRDDFESARSSQYIEKQMAAARRQADQVERRRSALQQLHADVTRMYRDALEMRICTEELWGRLTEKVSPAKLTKRLAELRRRLTDQFHLANQSLSEQRQELHGLVTRLETQHSEISQQREKLQQWLARRHTEIERQAARLVGREQELDRQRAEIQKAEASWAEQRRDYEETIRQLRRQIVHCGPHPLATRLNPLAR
jgi:hypothetical protein